MRTIHELLILLRDNIKPKTVFLFWKRIDSGLCYEKDRIFDDKILDDNEYFLISQYMRKHLPRRANSNYSWEIGLWKPRLKWLNEHIELTK